MNDRRFLTIALTVPLLLTACTDADNPALDGEHPAFSPEGKFDGAEDDIRYVQDIGTDAKVKGRFQRDVRYRGFTLFAEAGQTLEIDLDARREVDGFLDEAPVDAQLMLYGPVSSQAALFTDVVADSGVIELPSLAHEVDEDGFYLIVATRPEDRQNAQFELDVKCPQCQTPPPADELCRPGRLFVEGATLRSQTWDRCEVIVLEPTRLPEGETLVIGPDVDVRAHYFITDFHPQAWGETAIHLAGELSMESTPDHPITFETNVPGRQWRGLIVERPGTHLHHFVMSDSIWGVDVKADSVRINDAEFAVNRRGVRISARTAGLEVERVRFHDNEVALTNRYQHGSSFVNREQSDMFILDSEFSLNGVGIQLWGLEGSFLDGLDVNHNDVGIEIRNSGSETAFPDDWVSISNIDVSSNGRGLDLTGNGVVDRGRFVDNATNAIRSFLGWQKVKNSLFKHNGRDCDLETNLHECATLYADQNAHTVFRNNVITKNHGHGILLEGTIANLTPRDPAVLNSEITDNEGAGLLFYNAPVFSVEFNRLSGNAGGQMAFWWQSCPHTSSSGISACRFNDQRIERNNVAFDGEAIVLRNLARADVLGFQFRRRNSSSRSFLNATNNFFGGLDESGVIDSLGVEADVDWAPTLSSPEPLAGLIVPLDFE